MDLIETARELARSAHSGQTRKDGVTPYIEHPLAVAATLSGYGYDDETVAAGLLHDVIEDTTLEAADLDAAVGPRVRELVEAASEPDKTLSWRERKTATLAHLPTKELAAQRVIAADKLDNVRSIGEALAREGDGIWDRFRAPFADQAWYYRTAAAILGPLDEPLFDELVEAVRQVFGDPGTTEMDGDTS
ncbi:MAG: HD domain-containing protein [Gammaproteobacteria bacterium]|nr:HD domain-containing protein [Gammaproteobacteria bacterium]